MAVLTVVLQVSEVQDSVERALLSLIGSPLVKAVWISSGSSRREPAYSKCRAAPPAVFNGGDSLNALLDRIDTPWLFIIPDALGLDIPPSSLERLLEVG